MMQAFSFTVTLKKIMRQQKVRFGRNYVFGDSNNSIERKPPIHVHKPVRLRTPDHLPMDHSSTQARQQAMQQRQRRLTTTQNIRKACIDSGSLRQYSKKRFDFAVQNASVERERYGTMPRPSTTPVVSSASNNVNTRTGPTTSGSLLYNRIPFMLNSIRVRPQSETAKYNHTGRTYPDIERTLRQSNCEFTVRSILPRENLNGSTSRTFSRSLMSREYSMASREHSTTSAGNSITSREQSRMSQLRGVTSRCSGFDYVLVPAARHPDSHHHVREFLPLDRDDVRQNVPETFGTPRSRHSDAMSESCSSESTLPGSKPIFDMRTTPNLRPPAVLTAECSNRLGITKIGRPVSESRQTGSDASLSGSVSSSNSSRSERPKCWVDDVTISSDVTEEPENNAEVTTPRIEDSKLKISSSVTLEKGKQKVKAEAKQVRLEGADGLQPGEETGEKPLEEEVKEVIDEPEVIESPRVVFPNFLCPSSERKSRQTAIKMWLAQTSFTCADRNVPLL